MNNYKDYIYPIRTIANANEESEMVLCLETILNGDDLIFLLEALNHSNIKVVFDTGNRIAFGHNLFDDIIKLRDRIKHVHLKDKNIDNKNVLLGTGLVNFSSVFKALKTIDYRGLIHLKQIEEKIQKICRYNMDFAKFFHSENFF